MKLILLLFTVFIVNTSFIEASSTSVYICVSPNAKKYHFDKNCRGLQKCTHEIRKVTKEEAMKKSYTACLLEKK